MSKINQDILTEEEIEEELLNNDLINSGGVENQSSLQQMNLEEKKNLLRCIKQSKDSFHPEAGSSSRSMKKPIIIDTTPSEFPPLPTTVRTNRLKLPKRESKNESSESKDTCINLIDDDPFPIFGEPTKFSLPCCVSDNAPPLPMPDRAFGREKCPYYRFRGESREDTLRRMLHDHDSWKNRYIAETRKLESQALVENIASDEKEGKNEENGEDGETDPYIFTESTKTYSKGKKKETKMMSDSAPPQNSRTPQRRTSRDSDCEEITPILKTEDTKLGEWMTAAKPRNKRNRKQDTNRTRLQGQPDIEIEFENRSLWGGRAGPQSPAPTRRSYPPPGVSKVQEEEKNVQCPICQQNFTRSTIENHAATCEGFSSSPMDVEEGL
ncbi:uncharacterized protein LOC128994739 [Macrosteles quadrilineatus]|uniref:uncharacterized protein LOC128994739 n=1 Tax=Macrosteles quadrilineatus TaxID=74068 RepID=UPI0023E224A2|nr:uncharacterized protein LOC128994739 [Macrosteles quadrilineatus]